MTKEQKLKRNRFAADFDDRGDDFILTDLDLMLDEVEPHPVPLNPLLDDDDVIDRLLITANYKADDERGLAAGDSDSTDIEDISLSYQFTDFDEFVVEPIEKKEQTESEGMRFTDFHNLDDFEELPKAEDAIDRLLVNTGFETNNELNGDAGAPNARLIDDISTDNKPGINFEEQNAMTTDGDIIDSEENKLMLDKDKTASAITYVSLGFGIIALLSSVVMGILLTSVQTKVSKLTELVSILEEDMSSIAEKNSDLEINNSSSSLERLNQKVNGFPKQPEKQTPSSSDISEIEMTADLTKESTANKPLDNLQAKSSVSEKEKPLAAVKKISPETKANRTRNGADWSVNLTAYEDLGYAKSKAAKYLQKGISVKVTAVDMDNTTWYRLRVSGFKNKEEATSYAAKIKKSLNLNSVSVTNN